MSTDTVVSYLILDYAQFLYILYYSFTDAYTICNENQVLGLVKPNHFPKSGCLQTAIIWSFSLIYYSHLPQKKKKKKKKKRLKESYFLM